MAIDTPVQPETPISEGSQAAPKVDADGSTEQKPQKRPDSKAQAAQRRQRTRQQYSMPFVSSSITLKSFHAQQTYERGFQQGADALFTLSVLMRVVAPEDQAVQVDEVVNKELSAVVDELKQEFARLDQLADSNGISLGGLNYSMPATFTPQVTSPRAAVYLKLLGDLDKLVETMDALWLSHVISDGDHSKNIFKWKRRILRLAGTLRNLANRGMASAQRKGVDHVQDPRVGTLLDPDAALNADDASVVGEPVASAAPATEAPVPKKRAAKPVPAVAAEESQAEAGPQEAALAS